MDSIEQFDVQSMIVRKFGREFQYYPWLKGRLFNVLLMGEEVLQKKTLSVLFKQFISIFYGFFSLFRKYDAWAFTSSMERVELEGQYFDKVMDPLFRNTNYRMLLIELKLFKSYKRSAVATKHVVSKALFMLIEEFYLRIFLKNFNLEGLNELKKIEVKLDAKVDTNAIVKKYLAQYKVMKFYLRILPNPKIVFFTVSYSNFGYIRALKEAGIRVVEIQHGLIGESNPGYTYHKSFDSIQFPDELLVFGENDREIFKSNGFPIKSTFAIGRFITDYYFQAAKENSYPLKNIVVSLQDSEWSFALLDFVFECERIQPNQLNWVIQTRRTPKEVYMKKYDFPANISFSSFSIYEAMSQADAHLTIFSTTAIESLSIGKPTFLYNYQNAATTFLGKLLNFNSNTYFCDNADEFLASIQSAPQLSKNEIAISNSLNIATKYASNVSSYLDQIFHEA